MIFGESGLKRAPGDPLMSWHPSKRERPYADSDRVRAANSLTSGNLFFTVTMFRQFILRYW